MKKEELKELITESVLNFLNDAKHWPDFNNTFDFVDELPDTIKVDKGSEEKFDVPVKDKATNKPLFTKNDGKTANTFKLSKKEN